MTIRKFICFIALCFSTLAYSQSNYSTSFKTENKVFNHLDLSVTAGSTGLGFDLSTPVGPVVSLRTGFAYMPKFNHHMHFDIQVGDEPESKYDANGNRVETKFDRLADYLKQFTGYTVEDQIEMIGEPHMYNFKLLVDVFPFRNKHWHFTTGFYVGPSKIAKAYNVTEAMPSLLAVGMYNKMYEKALNDEPIITWGSFDIYGDRLLNYGRMGIHVGNHVSDGSSYRMEPDEHGMVKAKVKVNSFKPYIGFGYGGALSKRDDKYQISFDCGTMFWGSTPRIITHDGTNLAKDVDHIGGRVEDYVDLIKGFKVFPVINIRLTRRLF
ncbi:MAG: hypothetical protein IJ244_08420 [Bacteroidaceae bacterium]|nr:hypothetical protein [Bacteroidaceae bacterium]